MAVMIPLCFDPIPIPYTSYTMSNASISDLLNGVEREYIIGISFGGQRTPPVDPVGLSSSNQTRSP